MEAGAPALDARRARAAVTFAFFAHGAVFATWASRIPAIKAHLGLSNAQLGLALLAGTLGGVGVLPLAGWIVARAGSRSTVARIGPAYAALLPVIALAPSLPTLALVLVALSASAGSLDIAMQAHGLAVERRRERPLFSSLHGTWSIGGLVGAALGALMAHAGVRPLPHFVAVAVVIGAGLLGTKHLLLPGHVDSTGAGGGFRLLPLRLLPLALLAFCSFLGESAAYDWSAVYVAGPVRGGAALGAVAFAAFSVAMAAFRLAGDRLVALLGTVRLLRGAGLAAAAGLALALSVPHPAAALAGFAVMGAGIATFAPIAFRAAGSVPGLPSGAGIAALSSVGYAAFIAGPPGIGFTAGAIGLRNALWIVVGLLALLLPLASVAAVEDRDDGAADGDAHRPG